VHIAVTLPIVLPYMKREQNAHSRTTFMIVADLEGGDGDLEGTGWLHP
jgi:hypothetical protein